MTNETFIRLLRVGAFVAAAASAAVVYNAGGWVALVAAITWALCMEFREALKRESVR